MSGPDGKKPKFQDEITYSNWPIICGMAISLGASFTYHKKYKGRLLKTFLVCMGTFSASICGLRILSFKPFMETNNKQSFKEFRNRLAQEESRRLIDK